MYLTDNSATKYITLDDATNGDFEILRFLFKNCVFYFIYGYMLLQIVKKIIILERETF